MNFNKDYYYIEYENDDSVLNKIQNTKLKLFKNNKLYSFLLKKADYFYLILTDNDLLGFFTLELSDKYIKISSLYVCKQYRNKDIATEVINEVIFAIKYNNNFDINCILVNSFVDSALFFLKRGFDFCKINKKLDYKKKNIVLLKKTF